MAAVTLDKANPELVKLWHPTKNGDLKPETITSGSNKIIWWLCIKGHEWESSVYNMCKKKGNYCSFCSGQLPCKDNCLATLYPEIAKQWHPTKNGDLKPDKVLPHSSKKVWWLCEKGHEWPAAISDRTCINGTGCPYCSGKKPCYDNCLATLRPDLAKEWHPTKNDRTPSEVTLHSGYEAWWLCIKGHEWPAKVDTRSRGVGCPKCRAQISQLELRIYCELKYLFPSTISKKKIRGNECDVFIPEIKAGVEIDGLHWHRHKHLQDKKKAEAIRSENIILIGVKEVGLARTHDTDIFYKEKDAPLNVVKRVVRTLNEQCKLDQNSKNTINIYLQRQTFANDSEYKKLWYILPLPLPGLSLSEQRPDIAKEWHPGKNGSLTPSHVPVNSHKKVWWLCSKGHEYQATVINRSHGWGCPFCSGKKTCIDNCLATLRPDLAKEWHPTKNDRTPSEVTLHSGYEAWWLCSKNITHEWPAKVNDRTKRNGHGCPYCKGRRPCVDNCLATLRPDLAKEWHPTKNDRTPSEVTLHSGYEAWWLCSKNITHEWPAKVNSRTQKNGSGCPKCAGRK